MNLIIPNQTSLVEFAGKESTEIFTELLSHIDKVNFRTLAGNAFGSDEDKKITQRHYQICVVEYVLQKSQEAGYNICKRNGMIYVFNGCYWQITEDDELRDFLGKAAEQMGVDRFQARHYDFRYKLFQQFLSSGKFQEVPRQKETVLINLINGTYEISPKSQQIRDHCENDFLTYQLNFAYTPTAKAPLFKKYLDTVLPDTSLQNILAEYIGYIFIRHLKLEKVLLLYGGGSNGKSVFFEVINALLGKHNVSNFTLQSLTDPVYRAKLGDKLLNYGSEIKGSTESDIFKQLASGEPVEAKSLYKDPFTMHQYARLMFNCNRLPKDVEHTEAYFRRFLIIPFDVTITDDQKDVELPNKIIAAELAGVFNWVLHGLNRLLAQKRFTSSDKVDKSVAQYRNEADTVAMFLAEQGYIPGTGNIDLKDIYSEFKNFCIISGFMPLNRTHFRERLENNRYIVQRRNSGNVVFCQKASGPF